MGQELSQDKTIFRGQTASFVITVTDEGGVRFDLTGSTLYMRIKQSVSDPDPAIVELLTGTGIVHRNQTASATVGQADIVVTSAQTKLLTNQNNVYDVWLVKPSGDKTPVVPVSKLTVLTPVTLL